VKSSARSVKKKRQPPIAKKVHEVLSLTRGALVPLLVERELGEAAVVEELAQQFGEVFGALGGVRLAQHRPHLVVLGADELLGLCGLGSAESGAGCNLGGAGCRFLRRCGRGQPEGSNNEEE